MGQLLHFDSKVSEQHRNKHLENYIEPVMSPQHELKITNFKCGMNDQPIHTSSRASDNGINFKVLFKQ